MKKTLGIIVCGLLTGCSTYTGWGPNEIRFGDEKDQARSVGYPNQDDAPLPWISILPSKRAVQMENVDFHSIAKSLRYDMKFPPFINKFKNVRYVLLDYGIEEVSYPDLDYPVIKAKGVTYSKGFSEKEKRYVMNASFYTFDNRPPNPPCFEEKIYMKTEKAYPDEAIRMMAHEIVLDHLASPLKKLDVDLD